MDSTENNSMDTKEAVNRAVLATAIAAGALASSCTPRNNNNVQQAEQESNPAKEQIIPEDDPFSIANPANQQSSLTTLEVTDIYRETPTNIEEPTQEVPTETTEPTSKPTGTPTEKPTLTYREEVLNEIGTEQDIWKLHLTLQEAAEVADKSGFDFKYYQNVGPMLEVGEVVFIPVENDTNIEKDLRRNYEELPSGFSLIDGIIVKYEDGMLIFEGEEIKTYKSETGEFALLEPERSFSLFRITPEN